MGWDDAEGTASVGAIVVQDACARLRLPVKDQDVPGGPPHDSIGGVVGGVVGGIVARIPSGTVLTLPSGRPVGKTTTNVLLINPTHGLTSAASDQGPHMTALQGGRSCFALPTANDPSLPWAERFLELCGHTASIQPATQ